MARPKSNNVGLIGLGIIGSRIAATLRKRGRQVFVWNRTPRPEQNFVGSAAEVAELCDFIQIFVSDDAALLEVVNLLVPGLTAHHIVVAHCTVAPDTMRAAAQAVERRGARFLEAPFTGSKVAAENGQLVYYIGGDEMALKQARPILELSSKQIVQIGEIGSASVIKVATNIITAATAQIGAEALAIVRRAGISGEVFAQAMKSNASNSTTLEMKVPMMLQGDFEPHFSVKHMLKDVRIAARLARQFDLEVPMTEVASDMLLAEMKQGRADADYASVAQRYFPVSGRSTAAVPTRPVEEAPAAPSFTIEETSAPASEAPIKVDETEALKPEEPKPEEVKPAEPPPPEPKLEALKPEEPKPAEATPPEEAKPEEPKSPEAAKKQEGSDETAESDESANLSGGIRGWFNRFRK
jgi:3-hydroxyisobutyrate dehydrogenase-like beta-hydroxyacid dehydrogenase